MPEPFHSLAAFECTICGQKCLSSGGLKRHTAARHPQLLIPSELKQHTRIRHLHLDGMILEFCIYNSY